MERRFHEKRECCSWSEGTSLEAASLVLIDDVTMQTKAAGWIMKCTGWYYIQPNALKPTGWRLTVQTENNLTPEPIALDYSRLCDRFPLLFHECTCPWEEKSVRLITLRNKGEVQRMRVDFNSECCDVHKGHRLTFFPALNRNNNSSFAQKVFIRRFRPTASVQKCRRRRWPFQGWIKLDMDSINITNQPERFAHFVFMNTHGKKARKKKCPGKVTKQQASWVPDPFLMQCQIF